MLEPVWVERIVVEAVHLDQLREHGGLYGLRDENALESALTRARNKWAYEAVQDVATLAAAYGYGLATNHPYLDGNKRIAFLITVVFLGLNGWDFEAPEEEVVTVMLAVADNRFSETELGDWIRSRIVPAR